MAGPNNRTVDAATTEAMLRAFDTAQNESRTIRNGVLNAQGQLGAMWQGAASSKYQGSINKWIDGFTKVEAALNELNGSMGVYRTVTNNAEANNSQRGSGWAGGIA